MKIGVIHATNNAVSPLNEAFTKIIPDIKILNFLDENIQGYANEINGIDAKIHRDFLTLATQAEGAKVDVIVVACTVLTPIVDTVKPFISTPIMAIDRPMLEKAVTNYNKIGLIATNGPTAPATQKQIEKLATQQNKEIQIEIEVDTEAMSELKSGNTEEHNHLNYIAAKKLQEKGCEVIILAQVTQASAEDKVSTLDIPVLTSPTVAMEDILDILKEK